MFSGGKLMFQLTATRTSLATDSAWHDDLAASSELS
jgi:hypothetical protein